MSGQKSSPRNRKRKANIEIDRLQKGSTSPVKASKRKKSGDSGKASLKMIEALFESYKSEETESIETDGMLRLCADMGVDPEDPVMILLSFYMEAKIIGIYERKEFVQGLQALGCSSISDLRSCLVKLRPVMTNWRSEDFLKAYKFSYMWACDSGQKVLPKDTAVALWRVLLKDCKCQYKEEWLNFVCKKTVKGIPKDTWLQFYRFVLFVQDRGISKYDVNNDAFPVIIDEFVEYLQSKKTDTS